MSQDLIDFSILPQSKVQNYENKIEEQNSTIEALSKKVTHLETLLEGSKTDSESKVEPEIPSTPVESQALPPTMEEKSDSEDEDDSEDSPIVPVEKEEEKEEEELAPKSSAIIKGRNLNKECRVR